MAFGHTSGVVAAYSSGTAELAGAFCARPKGSWLRAIQLLAVSPVVSGAFISGATKLEVATAGYFWLDSDPFLCLAGLLLQLCYPSCAALMRVVGLIAEQRWSALHE